MVQRKNQRILSPGSVVSISCYGLRAQLGSVVRGALCGSPAFVSRQFSSSHRQPWHSTPRQAEAVSADRAAEVDFTAPPAEVRQRVPQAATVPAVRLRTVRPHRTAPMRTIGIRRHLARMRRSRFATQSWEYEAHLKVLAGRTFSRSCAIPFEKLNRTPQ